MREVRWATQYPPYEMGVPAATSLTWAMAVRQESASRSRRRRSGGIEREVAVEHDAGACEALGDEGVLDGPGGVGEVPQARRDARLRGRLPRGPEAPELPPGGR